ncbi:CLUMA_CG015033, isoform B [Clunio marinus]|uniref:CLUMA_CG015033, isoform B n=1 Tax=Clunio marinus TaxID=568069 RepID=A0A1J1IQ14_9DIPT|nr:CLUMA_CG015033, isoform B [Clunio marinus]
MSAELDEEQVQMLRRAFSMFDSSKSGKIEKEKVRTILNTLGHTYDDSDLDALLEAEDTEGRGTLTFDEFCRVAVHFSDEDDEALQKELKEAFRLYDKEGNGYIPTSSLREILAALDDQLTSDQLNEMIAEIDTDSSGTVDFDEFTEFMRPELDIDYYNYIDELLIDTPVIQSTIYSNLSGARMSKFDKCKSSILLRSTGRTIKS